eukprot:2374537-Rhodomonas_salina.4
MAAQDVIERDRDQAQGAYCSISSYATRGTAIAYCAMQCAVLGGHVTIALQDVRYEDRARAVPRWGMALWNERGMVLWSGV